MVNETVQSLYQAILDGDRAKAVVVVQNALSTGVEPAEILNSGMVAAMGEVGRLFEEGEYYVPEMLIAARAMQAGLSVLKPYLVQSNVASAGKVVAGTVKGDLHDIGKNLVCMMLEGSAFEIIDLGSDVGPDKFVEAVRSTGAEIVMMSALLTTTMPYMKVTIDALEKAGLRSRVKVMIGGAPITQKYADEIGADGYAPDASRAVARARELLQ